MGVVASRRLGGAVFRNRAKRLIREAFRLSYAELPPGLDLVVIAGAGIRRLCLADVARDFVRARRDLGRRLSTMAPPPARS